MEEKPDQTQVTAADLTFTYHQLMDYLRAVGRSAKCPVCPHEADWIFHTEPDNDNMAVYAIPLPNGTRFMPVACMECPKCGFIQQTSLFAVLEHFKGYRHGQ